MIGAPGAAGVAFVMHFPASVVPATDAAGSASLLTTSCGAAAYLGSVTETTKTRSPEFRLAAGALGGLRQDLFHDAFAYRPLPPMRTDGTLTRRLSERMRARAARTPHALVGLAALITALIGIGAADGAGPGPGIEIVVTGLLPALTVAMTLFRPVGAFWMSMALTPVTAVITGGGWPWVPSMFFSHLVVLVVVAARTRPRTAAWMWVLTVVLGTFLENFGWRYSSTTGPMAVTSAFALLVVTVVQTRREAEREVTVQRTVTAVERDRRTLLEERTTIARELHDVVAHHMSVVAIQAEAAPYRVENPPPELEQAFVTIRENAVAALTELRRVLGVVRAEDYEAPGRPAAHPRRARQAAHQCGGRGSGGREDRHRRGARTAAGRRAVGVPDHPGSPQQHPAARARRHRQGRGRLCARRARATGRQRAADRTGEALAGRRARHYGDAGAGRHAERRDDRRDDRGRRVRDRRVHPRTAGAGTDAERDLVNDIRVLIVDDQMMVREGFSVLLGAMPGIEVVGEAVDGRHAIAQAAALRPDVVLMDIRMPELNGIEATRAIVADDAAAKVLVLTTFDLDEYVYQALRAGASGFLLKDASARRLADGVRVVASGEALLAPTVTKRLITEFSRLAGAPRPPALARIGDLTERETEVLVLIAQGLSNAEIASHLVVAESTIKTHVSRILVKLGLRDRTQAAVFAYEARLVTPG